MKRDSNGEQIRPSKARRRPGEAAVGDGLDHRVLCWNQGPARWVKWRHAGGWEAWLSPAAVRPLRLTLGTWTRWSRSRKEEDVVMGEGENRWLLEREKKKKEERKRNSEVDLDRQIGKARDASRLVRAVHPGDLKGPIFAAMT